MITFKEWLEDEYPGIEKFYDRKDEMVFAPGYDSLEHIFNTIRDAILKDLEKEKNGLRKTT